MAEWISVKDAVPPTPYREEGWDDDSKKERVWHNSAVHRVAWWNKKKKRWISKLAVYTSHPRWEGQTGWFIADTLETIHPDIWLPIPPLPDPPAA